MENKNAYFKYSSANVRKSDECTDYDAVIKQFDDLISELSTSNAIRNNVWKSDNLLDIIQKNTSIKPKESDFKIDINTSSNVPENFYSDQSRVSNLVISKNEIDSASQNMPVLEEKHSKKSSAILNSKNIKGNFSESGEGVLWINSHLWCTEKSGSQAKKQTSNKIVQNTSVSDDSTLLNRIDVPFAKKAPYISEHNYLNRNISDSDQIIKNCFIEYPENKRIKSHQLPFYSKNFIKAGLYDPKLEFQRDLTAKSKIWTSGSHVTMSPRMTRSSAFRCSSSDSCFMVKLFIETKDSHLGPFTFEIYPKMSLRLLKLKVEKEYGIVSSSQRWILGKTFAVDNDKSLVDYNVMPGLPIIVYVDNKHTAFGGKVEKVECSFDHGIQLNNTSEVTKSLDHCDANYLVNSQRKQCCKVGSENKSDSLDLKYVSKSKSDNLNSIAHLEKVLGIDASAEGEKSSDSLYSVVKSPASKKKFKRSLLLQENAEVKDSDSLKLNLECKKKFGFENTIEQNLNNEKNELDEILLQEKFSDIEGIKSKENSVIDKSIDPEQSYTQSSSPKCSFPCDEKEVLHSAVFSNTFKPISNLRAQEKNNLLCSESQDAEKYSCDKFEINEENISEKHHDATLRNPELSLELEKGVEKTVISSSNLQAENEIPEYSQDAISSSINKAASSKQSLTSILKKLSLTRKANSKDDADEFSKVDATDVSNENSYHSTLPAEPFNDIHIEISCCPENIQVENEHEENSNNSIKVENQVDENLEAVKNFELLQEIENTDLVQNTVKFTCPVCFDEFDSGQGAVLHDCLHMFCRTCLINSVVHAEGVLIKCPYRDDFYSCESFLQQREIKALVSEEVYEKYLQRSIMTAEGLADRSFHCKTPNCPGWCIFDKAINVFHCPVCFHYNCLNCQAIHEGLNCRQYQNKLKEQQKVDENAVKTLDLLNKMIESGKALKCPKCELILMKKWGCDWLKCSICKTEICWITKGPRWGPGGQGDTTGGCRCGVNGIKCHPSCTYCH